MRRWWVVAGLLAALGALAPSLSAATRVRHVVTLELEGSLTLAWQGDQARGCGAEGLCGVRGSLEMLPSGGPGGPFGPPGIELMDPNSATRVVDVSAGGGETTCVDLVPVDLFLAVRRTRGGALRAVSAPGFSSGQLPSAGRCAGPTIRDLLALALPARRLGRHGYDLSGQTTFGAGPFSVTAISTLRMVAHGTTIYVTSQGSVPVAVPRPGPIPGPGGSPSRRRLLYEHADAVYRIAGVSGALTTTFSSLAAPLCDPLGACGSTGELSYALSAAGTVSFAGSRTVGHRVGTRAALADLRAGRLGVGFGASEVAAGTLAESLSGSAGSTCADRVTEQTSLVQAEGPQVALAIVPAAASGAGDPFRTRCPGPSGADILGSSSLSSFSSRFATATVPTSALGSPRLTLTFRDAGSFTGEAYAGERGGSVVCSLVLEHASGGTTRVPVTVPIGSPR